MRRTIFITLGILEFAVAVVLIVFGSQLPSKKEVNQSFDRVQRVTDGTGQQVRDLRGKLQALPRRELKDLANGLGTQTTTVTRTLQSQAVDYKTVRTMSDSLGEVAAGLDGMASTLDPKGIGQLGEGLGVTASFLEDKVAPAASRTADDLDKSTALLATDAHRLKELVRTAPLDLQAARDIHDGLARFSEGLDTMNNTLKLQRLDTMREGFRGLEDALNTGAEQVERLAHYTYPMVTFRGARPVVEQRPFWPEGEKIAEGMRKAAAGATAAGKEMDALAADLPKLRASVEESRKMAERTRIALATALKQQDKAEPLLKDLPEHAARLADELPKLGADLARILRDTQKLKEVAAALRQAQKGIDMAVANWPELRNTLANSAKLLRATHQQLQQALQNRTQYEAAMRQTIDLADRFAELLPQFINLMEGQLREQERALDDLSQNIDEVSTTLPVYAQTTARMVQTGRLLIWLVATIVGLHGAYLVLSVRLGRRFSL